MSLRRAWAPCLLPAAVHGSIRRDSPDSCRGRGSSPARFASHPTTGSSHSAWESVTAGLGTLHEGYAAMLVLSRKKNESIVINNDITVTVVEIRGDKVRLGIVAPKEVPVHRQEVFEAIHGKPSAEPAPPTVAAKPVDASGRAV